MENLKNVAPIEDFNWDAYENGDAVTSASHEELEKAYDLSLIHISLGSFLRIFKEAFQPGYSDRRSSVQINHVR